jgi:C4-dicarboxylate transporter, DcuC family
MSILFTLLVIAWVIYMIVKRYYPQAILLFAGMALLAWAVFMEGFPVLSGKQACGSNALDIFQTIGAIMSVRVAGLGLTIMSIAGFAKYMDYLGAGKSLFALVAAPVKKVHSPYLLLVLCFYISQFLVVFIPSHAGLALLLMVTMYPVLIRAGVSKLSALGVIGCAQYMDVGPGSGNAILAASVSGLDPAVYFVKWQLPIFVVTTLLLGIVHWIVQKWWDKREGYVACIPDELLKEETERPPLVYALLPMLPMIFILGFSPLFDSPIKMDVVTAMFISAFIAMVFEFLRTHDINGTFAGLKSMFTGMGNSFTTVISLIVSGEVFAAGLVKIGAVAALTDGVQTLGLNIYLLIIIFCLVIAGCAFLMGSGNAAFFSFAALAPDLAASMGLSSLALVLPMQIMTSFGRVCSPITGAIAAIAGVAEVSPVQIVKRTCIPMFVAAIINIVFLFINF